MDDRYWLMPLLASFRRRGSQPFFARGPLSPNFKSVAPLIQSVIYNTHQECHLVSMAKMWQSPSQHRNKRNVGFISIAIGPVTSRDMESPPSPPPSLWNSPIFMKDVQCPERNEKLNFQFYNFWVILDFVHNFQVF